MSKQEEIKQALAAATPGPWSQNGAFINSDEGCIYEGELSGPDAHLIVKAPEYIDWLLKLEQSLQEDIMVLKDMVHTRNVENERLRKEIIVKDNSKEILTKQITDEVAISATAIVERNRLRKALSDVHNALRWGDAENALERVESIIEQALGQEGEGNQ